MGARNNSLPVALLASLSSWSLRERLVHENCAMRPQTGFQKRALRGEQFRFVHAGRLALRKG